MTIMSRIHLHARLARALLAALLLTAVPEAWAAISFQSLANGQNNDANTLDIGAPAGIAAGDVLVAQVTIEKGSDITITPPAGWVLVRRTNRGSDIGQAIYYKVATASEPASYRWNFSQSNKAAGGILRYTGVDSGDPIIDSSGRVGDGNTLTGDSVASEPGAMLLALFGLKKKDTTMSTPAGMTHRYLFQNPNDVRIKAADELGPANPTGNRVSSAGEGDKWVAQLVTLREASAGVAAGGFNAYESSTPAGAISGVIKTKIAGSPVSLDIIALNAARDAIETAFTGTVRVEVLDASDNSGGLDSNNCRPSWTVIQTLSPDPQVVAGDGGRKTITFTQSNSYPNARLRISYPAGAPIATGCSNDNFAIRPSSFASLTVSDTDWQSAGLARSLSDVTFGTVTHKAGRPLSVRASAVNGAGTPAVTTNYSGTPSATLSSCAGAACTGAFGTFTLGAGFSAGQLSSDLASYDNVGSFRLQLVDSTFASVDASDGSTIAERNITSAAIDVGRFVPDHFTASLNAPVFATACASGNFTYVGQAFGYAGSPVITVTARDFAGNATALYAGNWWRITNGSLTGKAYSAAAGTLDTGGLPGTDPVVAESGGGAGTLTFSAGAGLAFNRAMPVAPFDAEISLAINVIDVDGVAYTSNPARFGQPSAGNGISFSSGKSIRFGRLVIRNANGSQLVPLPVQMEAQYWGYTDAPTNTVLGFITHTADGCTSIANDNVAMSGFSGNLAACETALSGGGTFSAGRRTLLLAAPGDANDGSLTLTAVLDAAASGTTCTTVGGAPVPAAGASQSHLQGNWTGGSFDQNPSARAAFGVFKGTEEVIYIRENF